ncbi:hypothetical protein WT08_22160 [Burkholderia sp. MSMB1552]|nr:hypothetical protein WT08_22160 [Burkholderia sp. MSMB1552]
MKAFLLDAVDESKLGRDGDFIVALDRLIKALGLDTPSLSCALSSRCGFGQRAPRAAQEGRTSPILPQENTMSITKMTCSH